MKTRWNTSGTLLMDDADRGVRRDVAGGELVALADGTVVEVPRNNLAAAKALLALEKHAEQRMIAGMPPLDRERVAAFAAGTDLRLVLAGTDATTAAAGREIAAVAAGEALAHEDGRRLAEEFAQLLTGEGAPRKGYVMCIARKRLLVHDLDRVRAVLRRGLRSNDPEHMHGALHELARLLGLQTGDSGDSFAEAGRA